MPCKQQLWGAFCCEVLGLTRHEKRAAIPVEGALVRDVNIAHARLRGGVVWVHVGLWKGNAVQVYSSVVA